MRAAGIVEGCGERSGSFIAGQVVPSAVPNWRGNPSGQSQAFPPTWPVHECFPNVGNRNWDRSEFSALGLGLFLDLWKAKAKASTAARVQAALTAERVCGGFAVTTLTKDSRIANAHESA